MLTIEAGGPPSYTQATSLPTPLSATNRPLRRPLPQAAHAPLQRPVAAQRPSSANPALAQPQTRPQYIITTASGPSTMQYVAYPQEQVLQHQAQHVVYSGQPLYTLSQPYASGPQPVVIEQNQTIIQQSAGGQDLTLAQMQMQVAQQSATDQLLLQQYAETQRTMLAQAQVASTQQPVYVDQDIYIDQGQYVDVTNIQENNLNANVDYSATTEVIAFTDAGYADAYATGAAGDELVYVDEADMNGDYYNVEYEAVATGETYEAT